MNCCEGSGLLPLDIALDKLLKQISPVDDFEKRDLEDSLDAILAEDIHSAIDVPSYDNSAMDGYAFNSQDGKSENQLSVVGKSFAGSPYPGEIQTGQCIRIMTGAPVPKGCNTVIMQENCLIDRDTIVLQTDSAADNNIRLAGNDIGKGQLVLAAGKRLSPSDLGLLASIGKYRIPVRRRLKVGLFSTGDELRLPQQSLDPACIYDSNRFVVAAMLKRLNMEVLNLGIIPDEPEALRRAFQRCKENCDAIVSSGGVSVGEADYTKDILDEMGKIEFWKLAIKPGKPFAFGKLSGTPFFGLPGNPTSAAVTFHQLAIPALQKLSGAHPQETLSLKVPAPDRIRKRPGRTDFQRGFISQNRDGEYILNCGIDQSSGMLSSMSRSNCYIKLERDRGPIEAGEQIELIPFDRWLQ